MCYPLEASTSGSGPATSSPLYTSYPTRPSLTALNAGHDEIQPTEGTLGLSWHFESDTLDYKHRLVVYNDLTMRNVYKVLATQYDHIEYITPYTTRAKVLLQQLWMKKREWDDPIPHKHGWNGKISSLIWPKSSTQDGMKLVYLVSYGKDICSLSEDGGRTGRDSCFFYHG